MYMFPAPIMLQCYKPVIVCILVLSSYLALQAASVAVLSTDPSHKFVQIEVQMLVNKINIMVKYHSSFLF